MAAFDHLFVQAEDELDRRFAVALEREPAAERPIRREIWSMLRDIERTMDRIGTDLRDCNVILARTIDRMVRFEATGTTFDA